MNSINLTGRLTSTPDLRMTQSGIPVCSFTLAVKRPRVTDTTDFINCVAWRQSAEYIGKYGQKGDLVELCGVLTARKYEDKDGNKRTAYEVVADNLSLIGGRTEIKTEKPSLDVDAKDDYVDVNSDGDLPF